MIKEYSGQVDATLGKPSFFLKRFHRTLTGSERGK